MPASLTSSQKATLIHADRQGGLARQVPPVRGLALERRGYGTYDSANRRFSINEHGVRYAKHGIQKEGL